MISTVRTDYGELKREGLFTSYIIKNEEQFSQVGYKVMKSHEDELFLKSAKVKHNGDIKLIYETEGYRSLADICKNETIEVICCSLYKVISGIRQIQENGFLSHENAFIEFQHIYFEETLEKPFFIYVPLIIGENEVWNHDLENIFSSELMTNIKGALNMSISQKQDFLFELGDIPYSLERIYQISGKYADYKKEKKSSDEICLVSTMIELPLKFVINKERFTIGRRNDNDGVVDFTKQISRLHCSIIKRNGKYGVVDEGSKFGTKINSTTCVPGKFYELCRGDEVRIPAISFKVQ